MGKSAHLRYAARRKPSASSRRISPRSKTARGPKTAELTGQGLRQGWAVAILLGRLIWHLVRVGMKLVSQTVWLLRRYPAVALLIGWAILVGVAIAATTTIMNPAASVILKPGAHPGVTSSTAPAVASSPIQTNPPDLSANSLPSPVPSIPSPLPPPAASAAPIHPSRSASGSASSTTAALSLVLMSCSLGCLFLSRALKPRPDALPHRPDLTGRPRLAAVLTPETVPAVPAVALDPEPFPEPFPHPFEAESAPDPAETPFEQIFPPQLEAPVYAGPLLAADETDSQPLDPDEPQPVDATVVPETQDHPLDWSEPSLADSLDLRQRRPLSYWLG